DLTTKEDEENSDSSLENESNSANSNSTANNTAEEKSEQGTANSTKESEVETTASGNKTSSTESSQPVESGHSEKSGHSFFDTIAEIFNSAKDWVSDLLGSEGNSKSAGNTVVEPEEPRYFNQRDFSDKFGANFGNHACAATSLLNEVSEQYTANTGKQMTETQAMNAMQSAVDAGSVSKSDAYVTNWQDAANDMAQSVGLSGTYTYTTNSASASATIYAIETNSTPGTDHFVNSNGAGTYYDPWNGTTGNVTDLNLTTTGLGGTRDLLYQ
ncbi:MAG: hypothetical protein J6N81_11505, partial [Treponema sp.]|nr:hypothetical protein [Treponema sp.]